MNIDELILLQNIIKNENNNEKNMVAYNELIFLEKYNQEFNIKDYSKIQTQLKLQDAINDLKNITKNLYEILKDENIIISGNNILYNINCYIYNQKKDNKVKEITKLSKETYKNLSKCLKILNKQIQNIQQKSIQYNENSISTIFLYTITIQSLYTQINDVYKKTLMKHKCELQNIQTNIDTNFDTETYKQNVNTVKSLILKNTQK